jgi:hypothetical protein
MTDLWSHQVGRAPHRVTVYERADRGGRVYLEYYVDGKRKPRAAETESIRDARGRIQKKKQDAAIAEAEALAAELRGGRPIAVRRGAMTLDEGLSLAFAERGCYQLDPKEDRWTADALRLARDAVRLLGGGQVCWRDVTPGMIRGVWRAICREVGSTGAGHDRAKKTLIVFFRIARYLEGEGMDERFPRPMKGWRDELLKDWAKATKKEVVTHQPSFSEDEAALLMERRGEGDPRLALALLIGGRLRGGQAIRALRSHLDLSPGVGIGHGALRIPAVSTKKRIPVLWLNEEERAEIDRVLQDGYLRQLEAAFHAGELEDYPLFPGGRLTEKDRLLRWPPREARKRPLRPMDGASLIHHLHDLERRVGIIPEQGRGWHGLRRLYSDFDEESGVDDRVKDNLGGWKPGSTMRRGVYQKKENPKVLAAAAEARRRIPRKDGPGGI